MPAHKIVYMTIGLPASGKSTWAKNLVLQGRDTWKRINKDDLRAMVDAGVWSRENENGVIELRDRLIEYYMFKGVNIIVDDTNFAPKHKERITQLIDFHNNKNLSTVYELKIKDFTDVPVDVCVERDYTRPNRVGEAVIRKMYRQYLSYKFPMHENLDTLDLPKVVICDLDGTIADMGKRNPYDATTCIGDKARWHVVQILHSLLDSKAIDRVFFFSGRENKLLAEDGSALHVNKTVYTETKKWLEEICDFNPREYTLVMRKLGDDRRDSIVKKEFYDEHIRDNFHVMCAFDDRPSVIKECWYQLGIPVMNCGDLNAGNF